MSRKVLIVSSSLRANSNSELLAHEAERGARNAGHEVEFVSLKNKDIRFCKGCLACQKTKRCVIKDDMAALTELVRTADTLVFVTPIYYYELSGQLKTFLDRCNPLYPQEYAFRDVYLMTASAEDGDEVYETVVTGLKGWIACFPESRFAGVFSGGGLNDGNEAKAHPELMDGAYQFGKSL